MSLINLPEGLELKISVVGGQVKVAGPVGDKLVCYALLEAAKDAIRDFVASQQKLVQPANVLPLHKSGV